MTNHPPFRPESQASSAACACGHTAYWHSHGGAGDCEHDAECECRSFVTANRRLIVQRRKIAGWHVGIFRNAPFVIFDFGRVRIEVAYA